MKKRNDYRQGNNVWAVCHLMFIWFIFFMFVLDFVLEWFKNFKMLDFSDLKKTSTQIKNQCSWIKLITAFKSNKISNFLCIFTKFKDLAMCWWTPYLWYMQKNATSYPMSCMQTGTKIRIRILWTHIFWVPGSGSGPAKTTKYRTK